MTIEERSSKVILHPSFPSTLLSDDGDDRGAAAGGRAFGELSERSSLDDFSDYLASSEAGRVTVLTADHGAFCGADLSGHDLTGLDLTGVDLSHANLSGARLTGANLTDATLTEANLTGAELSGANLHNANLDGCRAYRAGLGGADLSHASLRAADLGEAVLSRADFFEADLRDADLAGACVRDADLRGATLQGCDLRRADLEGCQVAGARMSDVKLRGACVRNLQGYRSATWLGANIVGVDFCGAYMLRRHIMDENYLDEFRRHSPWSAALYYVWWATSDCGRSVVRWALWTALIMVVFAGFYSVLSLDAGDHETFLTPLYFSVVTLTSLGYGDVLPTDALTQAVVMVQVFIGYMMLGGLLSILANKMARRAD